MLLNWWRRRREAHVLQHRAIPDELWLATLAARQARARSCVCCRPKRASQALKRGCSRTGSSIGSSSARLPGVGAIGGYLSSKTSFASPPLNGRATISRILASVRAMDSGVSARRSPMKEAFMTCTVCGVSLVRRDWSCAGMAA